MLFFDSARLLLTELNNSLGTSYTTNDVVWQQPVDSAALPGGSAAYTYNTGIIGTIGGIEYFINYNRIAIGDLFLGLPAANQKVRLLNHSSGQAADSIALSLATQFGIPITGADIDPASVTLDSTLAIRFRITEASIMYKPVWHQFTLKVTTVLSDGKYYSQADMASIHPNVWSQDIAATDTTYTAKADPAVVTSRYDYTLIRGILKRLRPSSDMTVNAWISDSRLVNRLRVGMISVDGNPWVFDVGTSKVAWNLAGARVVYNGKVSDLTTAKAMNHNIPKNLIPLLKPARSGFTHVLIMRMGSSGVTQTSYGISNMLSDCALLHYNA